MVDRLTIELVPSSAFYKNVRSGVSKKQWDCVRKIVYRRAGFKCECCGAGNQRLDCHEIFSYKSGIQKLEKMVALCVRCHEVKHIGLAEINGRLDDALIHLAFVNDWSEEKTKQYLKDCIKEWTNLSEMDWELDIKDLKKWLSSNCPE